MKLDRNRKLAIGIYFIAVAIYASASGGRLRRHSDANHYVHMAYGWLHGRLDLGPSPPNLDDRAEVVELDLRDGRHLRGAFAAGTTETFRTTRGETIHVAPTEIAKRATKYYVSFPPFPAVLMVPLVAIAGLNTNDVVFTVALAGLAPALLFLLLGRLRARGDSARAERDDLWLTGVLAVGSVYFYASVLGQVWYTAQVVTVICTIIYLYCSLDARRPVLAGLALACGFASRPEILFAAPFFAWELMRVHQKPATAPAPTGMLQRTQAWLGRFDWPAIVRRGLLFALPVAVIGLSCAAFNVARFGRPTEFGHSYLNVRWTPRIQRYGLFNYVFLGRNLACLLALTPRLVRGYPWVQVSWHGLAIWVTTPVVLTVLWPRVKGALHRPLWLAVACLAIPDLLYQNSGWVQFGYRFALDYFPMLVCLMAIGGRPLTRRWKILVLVGVGVNLFGAITFGRMWQFYFDSVFPPGID